ncbi:type II toxin-antitoxin system prevent-host-death family antitoxin [Streptomyces sp.]|uniref:type II toxin-antitoxin system Phd/YefM family antitoxin n=1 Tax=Streptomyces sp. TaxID=1931 RepID=UPI002D77F36F|nr:type II toxin-antitoxin system prevent-host-death family antitoxin [Streptomyces sp.]HET6359667.1 type II toxin-antitoxin system prevent-host-death family antitoxin [Streptomyces sp.]
MTTMKRRRVPARELARHTASLLDAVAQGESIEVTRDGVPVAILAPVDPAERDIQAAISIGLLDARAIEDDHAAEAADMWRELQAVRKKAEGSPLTEALLAQRAEESR